MLWLHSLYAGDTWQQGGMSCTGHILPKHDILLCKVADHEQAPGQTGERRAQPYPSAGQEIVAGTRIGGRQRRDYRSAVIRAAGAAPCFQSLNWSLVDCIQAARICCFPK